jgi:putative nucleotidyltransferase with HDIG domain
MAAAAPFDLDQAILGLVTQGAVKIPPYPAIALQIEKLIRRGDYGMDDLASLVSSDQALAAELLRVSNSAAYHRTAPVTTARAAAGTLGAREVIRVALAIGLGAHAGAPGPLASLRRRVWLDALLGAALGQLLAPGRGLDPEEAFSAGLLHDFGKVICLAAIEQLVERRTVPPSPAETWSAIMERHHVELGLVMATRWNLPPVISDVISLHHADSSTGSANREMVDLAMAVDEVVTMLGDQTHLSPEVLGAAALLRGDEGERISSALPQLPAFVAAFESNQPWKGAERPSLVAAPRPPPATPGAPEWPVVLRVSGRDVPCQVQSMAADHIMLASLSPSPVPENQLLKMRMGCEPPMDIFATAKQSWPLPPGFSLKVQPFALSRDAWWQWRKLATPAG